MEHIRRSKEIITFLLLFLSACGSTAFAASIKDQVRDDMKKLLEKLPDEQKEVVKLRHYYDMSFKEISDFTNVSINTALGRMRYALINLRKMAEESGVSLEM